MYPLVFITVIVTGFVVSIITMTECRYGLSAPEETSGSGSVSAIDEDGDGDNAAAGAMARRHLSAKERKLVKKQVSAKVLNFVLFASKT